MNLISEARCPMPRNLKHSEAILLPELPKIGKKASCDPHGTTGLGVAESNPVNESFFLKKFSFASRRTTDRSKVPKPLDLPLDPPRTLPGLFWASLHPSNLGPGPLLAPPGCSPKHPWTP